MDDLKQFMWNVKEKYRISFYSYRVILNLLLNRFQEKLVACSTSSTMLCSINCVADSNNHKGSKCSNNRGNNSKQDDIRVQWGTRVPHGLKFLLATTRLNQLAGFSGRSQSLLQVQRFLTQGLFLVVLSVELALLGPPDNMPVTFIWWL